MAQSANETDRRMAYLVARATAYSVAPNEFVRRTIQSAVQRGNMFIGAGDGFVVMGYDGFDHQFFPCGSARSAAEARKIAKAKIAEEPLYSHGDDEVSATFHIFTREGVPVPLEAPKKLRKK